MLLFLLFLRWVESTHFLQNLNLGKSSLSKTMQTKHIKGRRGNNGDTWSDMLAFAQILPDWVIRGDFETTQST